MVPITVPGFECCGMTAVATSLESAPGVGRCSSSFAKPKSRTFAWPSRVIIMLSGLRSRWMIPAPCARQTLSRVLQELEQLSKLNSLLMNLLAQRHAIDKLHRDELCSVVLADFMDGSDVRMIKRRG